MENHLLRHAILLLWLCPFPARTNPQCHSDRDEENHARVTCGAMGLSSVPTTIDPSTLNLNLTHNVFASLDWGAYTGFPGLRTLDLRHNRVARLEGSGTLAELSKLHLSNNLLVDVPERAFVNAPKLMEVYLRSNRLRSVHHASFSGLPILEIVDLSRNRLTTLPADFLTQISSTTLKTLDLEENQIQLMPHNWFNSKAEHPVPYVFLSKNPWLCFCEVGYLQVYLEDQEFNVYVHTNPDSPNPLLAIENNAESVVCAHPPSMLNRPIMYLKEEEYCDQALLSEAPAPTAAPARGDEDVVGVHVYRYTSQAPTAPITSAPLRQPTAGMSTAVDVGLSARGDEDGVRVPIVPATIAPYHPPTTEMSTILDTATSSPTSKVTEEVTAVRTTVPVTTHTTDQRDVTTATRRGRVGMWTRRWLERWTVRHAWTESWTSRHEESSNWNPLNWSFFLATTPSWPLDSTSTPDVSTTIITTTTATPTTASTSSPPSTSTPAPPPTPRHPNILPPDNSAFGGSRGERAGARAWCTWLFAGLLLLCLLSALGSCLLGLGLAWAYLTLYRPLARRLARSQAGGDAHVRLLDYQTKADVDGAGGNGMLPVPFLPVDASGRVQATFRSVLFIAKTGEGEEEDVDEEDGKAEKEREDAEEGKKGDGGGGEEKDFNATTGKGGLKISGVGPGLAVVKRRNTEEVDESGTENKQVFRKTLYRVFSCEEELEGWRQVEEHWEEKRGMKEGGGGKEDRRKRVSVSGGADTERKTRYSLILREEKVEEDSSRAAQEGGMEWLVGEWEMGGTGGRMSQGDWASLFSGVGEDGPASEEQSSV